ncbi:MAG: c-type cytochrome [Methylomonas sp.]
MNLFVVGIGQAEIDAQAIALNCRSCHADAPSEIPPLQNLSSEQIRRMLLDFKYDRKAATLMPRIAKGYSDAELQAVADYLGRR